MRLTKLVEVEEEIIAQRAAGVPIRAVAASLGIPKSTVGDASQRNADRIEVANRLTRERVATKVLGRSRTWLRARMRDVENWRSKTAPQTLRTLGELAGLIGGVRDVTINGDIDARSVSIDARRIAIVQGQDLDAIRAESKRLADELGLNA